MIAYRDATPTDAPALRALFVESFTATFGHLYAPADLAAFLVDFTEDSWRAQLADPAFAFRVATDGDTIAGYAKIGPVAFPGDWPADAIELYQLYVLGPWQGTGIAAALMDWVLAAARHRGARELILSVYVDNHRARRFYQRYGFAEIGRYTFMVGDHEDDDRLMRLEL
ncbi:MAG: GNAT family N-acetyltransferase [Sphingomonas sp.]|uniref:GNAT family N-acetyltransferase n=1 Tax=Sphingomonas sp. TaxID=28214 RepID=UPI001AD440DC|nr:GNAT family N-acetyltransferase [Sphingomonas sp.]MBN8808603.1 GNAT family N-acetyltransferase [Sphingomonas sp.]